MHHADRLEQVRPVANGKDWARRHYEAIYKPTGEEVGLIGMLRAWLIHADEHKRNHGSGIGEDGYCGPAWARIGSELIHLLSGPMGRRLDGGTLDSVIREALEAEGFNADNL